MKRTAKMLSGCAMALILALPAVGFAAGMLDLPRTGQQRCYNTAGTEIVCSGTGQDGEVRTGAPMPVPRYKDNGDGTVTDKVTGMVWLKNANCFGAKTWTGAIAAVNALADGQCGLNDASKAGDWRLPNRNELLSLVDISRVNPSLQLGHPFVNVVTNQQYGYNLGYWTSSTYVPDPTYAWQVEFISGVASRSTWDKDSGNYNSNIYANGTMAVRSGQ